MHVKKNLMLWAAALALALPMLFVGTAGAFYAPDGSKMVPAGGWDITDKGVCITGIASDGTINTSAATGRPDCESTIVNSTTSSALCTGLATDGASHYWTSVCMGADGAAISLKDLDRTATNCTQRSAALGHGAGTMTSKCTGKWSYIGAAGDGAPGFAYTAVRLTAVYADSASCLANGSTIGYSWATGTGTGATKNCVYAYGIKGTANVTINKKDGSGAYATGGTAVDLSALTVGPAMYNGVSWSTGVAKGGTASLDGGNTIIATPLTLGGRAGCLECHNSTSQNNGYAERWKETYLKTGHKNMLRKVTAGTNLIGPDGAVYTTTDLAHNTDHIDFAAGTYTAATGATAGVARQLFYIYGDWMAAAPSVAYNNSLTDPLATNGYSCAACHATGFANSTAGVCTPTTSATTQAACTTAGGTWTASVGIEGVAGGEPAASFPGIKSITGTWQKDGITCARCHATTFPGITSTNASASMKVQETTGTHNNADIIIGANTTNLCYGCHQAPAKTAAGGADIDLSHPEYIPVKNTSTVMSATNPNGYAPEWNGHVLGNSFLNSTHGKFTGVIAANKLGKYNITSGAYASTFKGKYCRTATTAGGGSIMKTKVNATTGVAELIATMEDCNYANGFAADRTNRGYWQDAGTTAQGFQGSCTTCHDVHQSVVPEVGAEEPLVRECTTCHLTGSASLDFPTATTIAGIAHPTGVGTPRENEGTKPASPCEICHMAKATSGGFPQHLWRINADANYSTFPTKAAFYGGSCSVKTSAADVSASACATAGGTWTATTKDLNGQTAADGAYTSAIWVDLEHACGQCHNANGTAHLMSNAALAPYATIMHDSGTAPPTTCTSCHTDKSLSTMNHVSVSACTSCHARPGVVPAVTTGTCDQCHTIASNVTARFASGIHTTVAKPAFTWANDGTTAFKINLDASSSVSCTTTKTWTLTGSTSNGGTTGNTTSATYADSTSATVTLTCNGVSVSKTVNPKGLSAPALLPTGTAVLTAGTYTVTFTDTTTAQGSGNYTTRVQWGDGSSTSGLTPGGTATHMYKMARMYPIRMLVSDAGALGTPKQTAAKTISVTVNRMTITGIVTHPTSSVDATPIPLRGVVVSLKVGGKTLKKAITNATGNYTLLNVLPYAALPATVKALDTQYTVVPSKKLSKTVYTWTVGSANPDAGATAVNFSAVE